MLILLGITFLSFFMMHIAGSDVVVQKYDNAGITVAQEIIDAERARQGLDKPFLAQYLEWLGKIVKGDKGTSISLKSIMLPSLTLALPPFCKAGGTTPSSP